MPVISSQKIEFVDIPQNARFKMLFDRARSGTHHIALAQGELRPGARLFLHYHEFEEVVFITEGRGVVVIDGVETPVQAGDAILVPSRSVHTMKNAQTESVIRFISAYASNEVIRFPVEEEPHSASSY